LPVGQVPPPAGHGGLIADQTSDGSRLAVRDAANNARIDIWDRSGKRLHGFLPYGEEIAVDALVWTGNNRLITMSGNKVTGWEVPGLKAVFEVSGAYAGAFAVSPGRKWIALQTDQFIDVYDTATGKPLSRMVHGNSTKKPWQAFAVSRDGTQLASTELARAPYNEMPGVWSYATWDLKTGLMKQADRLFAGHAPVRGSHVMWIGPRLLLAGGSSVIDLDSRAVIASLTLNPPQPIASPDGRYWGTHTHQPDPARPVPRPVESIAATKLDDAVQALQRPAPADIVFRENSTIEVVSNTGNGSRDAVIRSQLNGLVVSEGYRGDRGGWRLTVSGQRVNTSGSLETEKGGRITIPGINGKIQLFDPTGAMVWETTASGGWDMFHTKYKGSTERVGGVGPGSGTITHYNFGGRDPGDAMAEEAWDNFVDGIKTSARFPRVLARVNGKIVPLPIALSGK
jgi:WD40 repeat protein